MAPSIDGGTLGLGMGTRLATLVVGMIVASTAAAEPVKLFAGGGLRAAMGDIGRAFETASGNAVAATFGSSGQLRERILAGEKPHVFAATNMAHPEAVAGAGRSGPVVVFARNRLCAMARGKLGLTTENLLDTMLKPDIRLATATPLADAAGDHAWQAFAKAEALKAGAREALRGKAIHPTGGASSEQPPAGRNVYGWFFEQDRVDVFLTYCTNVRAARAGMPELRAIELPGPLAVGADYGLVVLKAAPASAYRFALFVLSVEGQRILEGYSFSAPALPKGGGR